MQTTQALPCLSASHLKEKMNTAAGKLPRIWESCAPPPPPFSLHTHPTHGAPLVPKGFVLAVVMLPTRSS